LEEEEDTIKTDFRKTDLEDRKWIEKIGSVLNYTIDDFEECCVATLLLVNFQRRYYQVLVTKKKN